METLNDIGGSETPVPSSRRSQALADTRLPQSAVGAALAQRASLRVRDDSPPDACERYVANHPLACAYHRPGWLALIGRAFGHETKYLVAESEGEVAGVLPLVLFRSSLFGRFAVS